jgi:predicted nucleic acid-binding protein
MSVAKIGKRGVLVIPVEIRKKSCFRMATMYYYSIKTPDVLQLATAIVNKATAFITFDNDFKQISQGIKVVILSVS